MDVRPSWEDWAISLATAVAIRGDCTRRQVGAVVLDKRNRVVGVGYNGSPPTMPGCLSDGACPRGRLSTTELLPGSSYGPGEGSCIAIHAETNALLDADPVRRIGGWMAVSDAPCYECERNMQGAGLVRVVWPGGMWVV